MGGVCSVHYRKEKCATKILIKGTTHSGRIILNSIGITWLITLVWGGVEESAMGIRNLNLQRSKRENWFEPFLNIHIPLSPPLSPNFFICPYSTR